MRRRFFRPPLITAGMFFLLGCCMWPWQVLLGREPAFGVIADIQYGDKQGSVSRDYRGSLSRLEQCVEVLNKQPLDFVIQLGDTIDGYATNAVASAADLDSVLSVFNRLTAPKYHVVGNHCQTAGKENLRQRLGLQSFYYTFTVPASEGWRFVVLDGNDAEYGVMSDGQLDWLRTTLAQARQTGEKVVCFCHFPLIKAAAENNHMSKPEPVLAVLDAAAPCVVAWLAGHDHAGGYAYRKGVHHITLQGLVEAPGSTSFARIGLGADRIQETGFGNEPSRELPLCTNEIPRRLSFENGRLWPDNRGVHINAHGGGILWREGVYYWYGEHKIGGKAGNEAQVGVHVYSSRDLTNWKDEGIALAVSDDPASDITKACVLERPKVLFNAKTGKYVMWFHLELKGQGYSAARSGVAVADQPTGPFTFVSSFRPDSSMARDQTLFVDDDGKAYHLYASEDNKTLHIAQLSDDYLTPGGKFIRVFEDRLMEAPAICKRDGKYYFIGSGCTGWAPNAARAAVASSIWGPWKELGNPCVGVNPANGIGPDKTFGGQSTCILPVQGKRDAFIALFDIWNPDNAIDGRYVWLPVRFTGEGFTVTWANTWDLSVFD